MSIRDMLDAGAVGTMVAWEEGDQGTAQSFFEQLEDDVALAYIAAVAPPNGTAIRVAQYPGYVRRWVWAGGQLHGGHSHKEHTKELRAGWKPWVGQHP